MDYEQVPDGHFAAVDEWLAEMDAEYGPVPPEIQAWATRLVDEWAELVATRPSDRDSSAHSTQGTSRLTP
jgi:hypothetical protein